MELETVGAHFANNNNTNNNNNNIPFYSTSLLDPFSKIKDDFITFLKIGGCLESSEHNLIASISADESPI